LENTFAHNLNKKQMHLQEVKVMKNLRYVLIIP